MRAASGASVLGPSLPVLPPLNSPQEAKASSDKQNARIEHDKALLRVMIAVLQDDTELFKQFSDNPSFKKWLSDMVFGMTYQSRERPSQSAIE
jgi:type I restriction enzyme R subunit